MFDNYQEVPNGAELHGAMAEALAEIPKGVRLIVVSRGEPLGALARHRAHQLIALVDWPELRFTPAEAGRLVRRLTPGKWSRRTMRALHESGDGWCAGLILQLVAMVLIGMSSPWWAVILSIVVLNYEFASPLRM